MVCRRLSLSLILAVLGVMPSHGAAAATPISYFVDCTGGNDSNSGRSSGQPWRSLSKANQAPLAPGDRLLFRRGCGWTGPLKARWQGTVAAPITIGAYGSGALPRIENARENIVVTGSHQIFEYLFTRSNAPSYDSACQNQPQGWIMGWRFMSGASYNRVRYSEARNLFVGVFLGLGSHHNTITNNVFRDNDVKDSNVDSDAGAVAISVQGDNNEIAYNDISGSDACSRQHGRDGAAVDIYQGRYNSIHHNTARQNNNFVEVGNARSSDNTIAYNAVTSTLLAANFVVARGAEDRWGPTYRTRLYNNSVYLTGTQSYAVQCYGGCDSAVMTFKNNIVWSRDRVGYVDAAWAESNNVWWSPGGPRIWFSKSASSKSVDPRFVDAAGGDLRLAAGSPAIDGGTMESVNRGFTTDLDGRAVPAGPAVDIGAYERGSAPLPPPEAPPTTYAEDEFSRYTNDSWGTAPKGGSWVSAGWTADFDTNGTEASIRVPGRGQMRATFLNAVAARDIDARFRVKSDARTAGSGQYVYLVARRVNASTEYRAKLRVTSTGAGYVQAMKVIGNVESPVSEEVSIGHVALSGYVWVRLQVTGAGSTTLRIKAWRAGTAEPGSWQATGTDSAAGLQSAGGVGFRTYLSSSAATGAVVFSFDEVTVSAP